MKQLSLLPDEQPDKWIPDQKKKSANALRVGVRRTLAAEGFYNFAKLAEEALKNDNAFIVRHYGVTKQVLTGILESEFGEACAYQETIASYLEKVRTIPAYGLKPIPKTLPAQKEKLKPIKSKVSYAQVKNRE